MKLRTIAPYQDLHRDPKTGIAWVADGTAGLAHSCHPNISESGSVEGMRKRGYWGKNDRVVLSHGFYYNIDSVIVTDALDEIARQSCHCGGNHASTSRPAAHS